MAQSLRILVVDDNENAAEALALLLQLIGHHSLIKLSGNSALQEMDRFNPDLVLLDIGMPGLSGYDVAKAIRARAGISSLKLVALTGSGQPEDRQRALDVGFDEHLVKPIESERLTALLRTWWS